MTLISLNFVTEEGIKNPQNVSLPWELTQSHVPMPRSSFPSLPALLQLLWDVLPALLNPTGRVSPELSVTLSHRSR